MRTSQNTDLRLTNGRIHADANETEGAINGNQEGHTEEIQDIITKVPSWVVRWGIASLGLALLVIIIISFIIHYPETINLPLRFESMNSATPIIFNSPARIKKIWITPGTTVRQSQLLITLTTQQTRDIVLDAPIGGKVVFTSIIAEGCLTKPGQQLLSITSIDEKIFGVITIPSEIFGKIKLGQVVRIHSDEILSAKDNVIYGKISFITGAPVNDIFLAKVTMSSAPVKSWIKANAEIVTGNVTLFQRLFHLTN